MTEVAKTSKLNQIPKGILKFIREIRSELKKVVWLNRKQLINNTITVLLACLVIGIIIWISDLCFLKLSDLVFIKK